MLESYFITSTSLFICRTILFLYTVLTWIGIAYSQIIIENRGDIPFILYFTYLSYLFLAYYFGTLFLFSMYGRGLYVYKWSRELSAKKLNMMERINIYLITSIICSIRRNWNVASTCAYFITIIVFGIWYQLNSTANFFSGYLIILHIMNSAVVTIELILNKLDYTWFNLIYAYFYLVWYALLAYIYHSFSKQYIYPFLDPKIIGKDHISIMLLLGGIIFFITFAFLLYLAKYRSYIGTTLFKHKYLRL